MPANDASKAVCGASERADARWKTLDIAYKKKRGGERDGEAYESMKIVVKVNGSNANTMKAESK
jgi:hypothetical protein